MNGFRLTSLAATVALLASSAASAALLIDDFSDASLAEYTSTVILDANGGGSNTAAWQSPSGTLQLNTTTYEGIEQYAFIRNGLSLGVGGEIQVDLVHSGASQDLGLYVGGTTPVTGTRQDYVAVYARGNGQVFSRGFDGVAEYPLAGGGSPAYDCAVHRSNRLEHLRGWVLRSRCSQCAYNAYTHVRKRWRCCRFLRRRASRGPAG